MSDLHQWGPVTALPRLRELPVEVLDAKIRTLTPKFPVSLVIPMIPAEMDRPALATMLDELCHVDYLHSLVISLNKASAEDYQRTLDFFAGYPGSKVILWSESRAVQGFLEQMQATRPQRRQPGQGPGLLAGHGLPACRGEGRLHGLPGRRYRQLQP